jgi:DNA-binding transcriptional LysR family regulator
MPVLNDLDELRTFTLVAEAGSLSATARTLQLSTNAVSRRIMRLEGKLGVKLLRRSTRAVSLTAEGRGLYGRACRALDELLAAEEEARAGADAFSGPIRLAIPGGACSASVLGGLASLLRAHPRLQLEMRVANAEIDPVGGGFDVVLHVGLPRDSRLVARHLFSAAWQLAAAPTYFENRKRPSTPQDLSGHCCLRLAGPQPQKEWRLVDRAGHVHVAAVGGNFEADDSRVLGDATYAGLGVGVRPAKELAQAVKAGTLVRVLPQYCFAPVDVHALMTKGTARLARVRGFLDIFAKVLQEEA